VGQSPGANASPLCGPIPPPLFWIGLGQILLCDRAGGSVRTGEGLVGLRVDPWVFDLPFVNCYPIKYSLNSSNISYNSTPFKSSHHHLLSQPLYTQILPSFHPLSMHRLHLFQLQLPYTDTLLHFHPHPSSRST